MDQRDIDRILNGRQRRPTHPGELLREEVLPAAKLTQLELARHLGVSRKTVSEIVLGQRQGTVDMAGRPGRFFGQWPRPRWGEAGGGRFLGGSRGRRQTVPPYKTLERKQALKC